MQLESIFHSYLAHTDPRLKQLGEDKMSEWRRWFDSRLEDAIEAAADANRLERKCIILFTKLQIALFAKSVFIVINCILSVH